MSDVSLEVLLDLYVNPALSEGREDHALKAVESLLSSLVDKIPAHEVLIDSHLAFKPPKLSKESADNLSTAVGNALTAANEKLKSEIGEQEKKNVAAIKTLLEGYQQAMAAAASFKVGPHAVADLEKLKLDKDYINQLASFSSPDRLNELRNLISAAQGYNELLGKLHKEVLAGRTHTIEIPNEDGGVNYSRIKSSPLVLPQYQEIQQQNASHLNALSNLLDDKKLTAARGKLEAARKVFNANEKTVKEELAKVGGDLKNATLSNFDFYGTIAAQNSIERTLRAKLLEQQAQGEDTQGIQKQIANHQKLTSDIRTRRSEVRGNLLAKGFKGFYEQGEEALRQVKAILPDGSHFSALSPEYVF